MSAQYATKEDYANFRRLLKQAKHWTEYGNPSQESMIKLEAKLKAFIFASKELLEGSDND